VAEEAVRDLCRARADLLADRARALQRLGGFLLRHGRVWRGGSTWTFAHERWLVAQRFDDPALATTYAHIGRPCKPATPPWTPSRRTWPPGLRGRRSPAPSLA
jgi:hypothetical protein